MTRLKRVSISDGWYYVTLPAETLIFDQHGPHVAVVGDMVKMVPIEIRRDLGTGIAVDQGAKGGDKVILSRPATLQDGAKVEVETDDGDGHPAPEGGTGRAEKVSET